MELTSEEERITKTFIERAHVLCKQYEMEKPDWKCAIKFLMARKFDINRALQLYRNHEIARDKEDLKFIDPYADAIRKELSSEKFSVLIPTVDPTFPSIAIFRAKLHEPSTVSTKTVLRALVFQLDCALDSLQTQRNGLIFLYDMSDSKYRNFDLDLSQKILNLLKGAYPARLKKILILSAPFWFRAPFNLLRLVIPEKLWNRVWICEPAQLDQHIPLDRLPSNFGGTGPAFDHRGWLMYCYKCYTADHVSSLPGPGYDTSSYLANSSPPSPTSPYGQSRQTPPTPPKCGERGTDKGDRFGSTDLTNLFIDPYKDHTSLPMILSPPPFGNRAAEKGSGGSGATARNLSSRSFSTTPNVPGDGGEELRGDDGPSSFPFPGHDHYRKDTTHDSTRAGKYATATIDQVPESETMADPFETESPDPQLNFLPSSGKDTMDISGLIQHIIDVGGKDGLYQEYAQLTNSLNEFHKSRRLYLKKMLESGMSHKEASATLRRPLQTSPLPNPEELRSSERSPTSRSSPHFYSFHNFSLKTNAQKNRYSDVMCFDHSRVILRRSGVNSGTSPLIGTKSKRSKNLKDPNETTVITPIGASTHSVDEGIYDFQGVGGDDGSNQGSSCDEGQNLENDRNYINANYVDGFHQPRAYISTQGPLPKTFEDFWCMCWENSVLTIVMTTKLSERGRVKCGEYWPKKVGSSAQYGPYVVELKERNVYPSYILSQIELKHEQEPDTVRHITHLQFVSWPDYGVPSSALELLAFRDTVHQCQTRNWEDYKERNSENPNYAKLFLADILPPIVVHCSAGIGRTGTFITIDICIRQLEAFALVNTRYVVRRIRSQRAYSIQMPDQYVFCHTAILEFANREKMVPAGEGEKFLEAIRLNQDD